MQDCLFCKIVRGEVPSFKVYEDSDTLAFLDIHPVAPGHTLVVPKVHSTNIFDISSESWSAVTETTRKIAIAIEASLGTDGVNLMMNNREHAGQVVDHPHMHLIPRHKGDGFKLWAHGTYGNSEAEDVCGKIAQQLQKSV